MAGARPAVAQQLLQEERGTEGAGELRDTTKPRVSSHCPRTWHVTRARSRIGSAAIGNTSCRGGSSPARAAAPSRQVPRPGAPERPYQRESQASRRDRAEKGAIARYGGAVLDDEIPM
jgi:hypothetical protein